MIESKKPTILVVDDESSNVLLLSDVLRDDYRIKVAKNGKKALEIVETSDDIDLILLDIEMPQMNGYEVCKAIKNSDSKKHIPIIFLTGKSSEADEEYGLNLGAIDYITKPFSKSILKMRVRNQIDLKQKTDLLEQLSMYDGLTNIKNRRAFDEEFERIYKSSMRDKTPFAVVMIDIDKFKQYNDNYGHGMGDDTLRDVAKTLQKSLRRPNDFVARYGGEEFVVLLKDTDMGGLESVMSALIENVRNLKIEHKYSDVADYVTISAGLFYCDCTSAIGVDEILKKADEALYRVKESGRDNYLISHN